MNTKHLYANNTTEVPKNILLLGLILMLAIVGFLSLDLYNPSLPNITLYFNSTSGQAQLTISVFLVSFAVSQLIYGPLSDYSGRKFMLIIGLTIYLLGTIFCIFSKNFTWFIVGRAIQGIGVGSSATLSRTLLRDLFKGNKLAQVSSYLTVGVAIAGMLAPALGGAISQYLGYQANFVLMAIYGLITLSLIFIYLPETNLNRLKKPNIKIFLLSYLFPFRNVNFLLSVVLAACGLSCLIAYAIINPFLLQQTFHIKVVYYGLITAVIASGEIFGTIVNSKLVLKWGAKSMAIFGSLIILVAGIILFGVTDFFHEQLLVVCFVSFLATLSSGIILPNATAIGFSSFKEKIGMVGAIYGFLQVFLASCVSFYISCMDSKDVLSLAHIFFLIGGISVFASVLISRKHLDVD